MRKNDNGLVYCRLPVINATVLYLLTTVLYFLYSTLDILWQIQYCFVFNPPMQNTINYQHCYLNTWWWVSWDVILQCIINGCINLVSSIKGRVNWNTLICIVMAWIQWLLEVAENQSQISAFLLYAWLLAADIFLRWLLCANHLSHSVIF